MPLFTVDSGDDTTIEKQLKKVEEVYNSYRFRVVFWPYRTKNSQNTILLKDLIGPNTGEVMALWSGAARLYGGQMSYILPIVFAEFESDRLSGSTYFMPKHGLIGNMRSEMKGTPAKPMCTVNTRICLPLTTCHEIGHAAGLEDQKVDNQNLMFHLANRADSKLKPEEVYKISASSFAF